MSASTAAEEDDDETLNLRIQCQEHNALARMLELYGPKAKGYLEKHYGFCDADAETAVFQAAERAWKYGASFDPKQSLKSWYLRIVQRQAINIITDRTDQREVEFNLDNHDHAEVCDEPLDKKTIQRLGDLERCIEKLERIQKAIIREDLASDDVAGAARLAQKLGTTANSIYVSRSKAKANLKKCVENENQQRSNGAKP